MAILNLDRFKQSLSYEPDTGFFRWMVRASNKTKIGDRAGVIGTNGRRVIVLGGVKVQAHRLAWFFVHGEWPEGDIKQKNGDHDDCSINNLSHVSKIEQARLRGALTTNTSGFRGVSRHKNGRWQSSITANYKQINLGTYPTAEDASSAYEFAANLLAAAKTATECEIAADLIIQHRRKNVAWERLLRDGRRTVWSDFKTFANDVGQMGSDESTIAAVNESMPVGPDNFKWLVRPQGEFDRSTKEGRAAYARAYREANPERYRHAHITSNYGIDDVEFERMKMEQGGKCLICEEIPEIRLAIDHDHDTKAVRSLLCKQCNYALGQFGDNLNLLRSAVRYMEKFEVSNVIPFERSPAELDYMHATLGFGT